MKFSSTLPVLLAALALAGATPALADRGERRGGEHFDRDHWRGDIGRFHDHDYRVWRGGSWYHGLHEGRMGWWWVTAGLWYFYPAPVYPYPDPYIPPVVVQSVPRVIVEQPVVVEQPAPVVVSPSVPVGPAAAPPPPGSATPAPVTAPAQSWFYCKSTKGYYPYVQSCPEGWTTVPATPPDMH